MKQYKDIEIQTITKDRVLKSIRCDKCGKKVKIKDNTDEVFDIEEWEHGFGYGSKHDGQDVKFDLCDKCFENFIKSFKYPPLIEDIWDFD